jgi:hypothetical protein
MEETTKLKQLVDMKPKNAVLLAQLIGSLYFIILISNSWDFYFWPKLLTIPPGNNLTFVENFVEKDGKLIWVDKQSGNYELVKFGKDYKNNLQLLKNQLKNKRQISIDLCYIGSKKYFYNIKIGDKLFFSENDVITKLGSEKESTLHIIMFSGMLSLITCWVIFEIKKWIHCHPTA